MTAESPGPISPREGAALWTVHGSLRLACALRCTVTPLTLSLRGPPGPALQGSWEPWAALPLPRWRVSSVDQESASVCVCFLFTVSPSCCLSFSSFTPEKL